MENYITSQKSIKKTQNDNQKQKMTNKNTNM